jgi:CubicO group peptidase (beta-lactamase class C family)
MRTKYSCLGYIILGATIKKITNKNVKELFNTLIIDKLHLKNTFLHSNKDKIAKTAATENGSHYEQKMAKDMGLEFNNWRKYLIRGEVHDSNSYFADSETGNAGLFSTIYDLFKIAQLYYIDSEFFSSETAKLLYSNNTEFSDEHWSLGWKLATSKDSIGKILSENAIGHTGFTGCSIWIEPFAKKVYILLTNRIHPQVNNVEMNKIRVEFHKLAKKLYG